jgi:hypothetical protein
MSSISHTSDLKVEIVSPPDVSEVRISELGPNTFGIGLNIVMVIRFPNKGSVATSEPEQCMYADSSTPQSEGETTAFRDFTRQHGYAPKTREVLAEWVQLQQGGL